jgi:hypothetical protein
MTRSERQTRRPKWLFFLLSVGLGAVGAGFALAGGDTWMAIFAVVLMAGFGAIVAFTPWEWSVIVAEGATADERQRAISTRAMAFAYFAVIVVAVAGFFAEILRGAPGPFTLIAAVGGFSHMAAIAILQRRS